MSYRTVFLYFFFLTATTQLSYSQNLSKIDYLIQGALVFDGSLSKPVQTDVGIKSDRIVFIGNAEVAEVRAKQYIHAYGLYLSPGFIDPHTHNDRWLNSSDPLIRRNLPSLAQGVTTVFIGNDGAGTYEVAELFDTYKKEGIGTNVAIFVGLAPVREAVLGKEDVAPNEEELNQMKALVEQAMKEGAFGLSTGLYYAPQTYASTEEVVALAEVAQKYNGIYDTHMRSESNDLIEAVNETINIGRTTGIKLMISHIKALGPAAWGKSTEVIQLVEEAQKEGLEIFANQYPYDASHTSLRAMTVPAWAQSGGNEAMQERLKQPTRELMRDISRDLALRGGDSRIVFSHTQNADIVGLSLHDLAAKWGLSPEEAIVRLLLDDPNTSAVSFSMDEEDVDKFMQKAWVVTGSDGGGRHPRAYGTFARKIKEYSFDSQKLSLEWAIHSSTGLSAELLGIQDRGFIKQGYIADLVLFNPEELKDKATFEDPELLATGINYVFVNGILVIENGNPNQKLAGKALIYQPNK